MATAYQPYVPRYTMMRAQHAAAATNGDGGALPLPSSFPVPGPYRRPSPLSLSSGASSSSSSGSGSLSPGTNARPGADRRYSNSSARNSLYSLEDENNEDAPTLGLNLPPPARPGSIYSARVPSPLSRSVDDRERPPLPTSASTPSISVTPPSHVQSFPVDESDSAYNPASGSGFGKRLKTALSKSSLKSTASSSGHGSSVPPVPVPPTPVRSYSPTSSLASSRQGSPNGSRTSLALPGNINLTHANASLASLAAAEEKLTTLEPVVTARRYVSFPWRLLPVCVSCLCSALRVRGSCRVLPVARCTQAAMPFPAHVHTPVHVHVLFMDLGLFPIYGC